MQSTCSTQPPPIRLLAIKVASCLPANNKSRNRVVLPNMSAGRQFRPGAGEAAPPVQTQLDRPRSQTSSRSLGLGTILGRMQVCHVAQGIDVLVNRVSYGYLAGEYSVYPTSVHVAHGEHVPVRLCFPVHSDSWSVNMVNYHVPSFPGLPL